MILAPILTEWGSIVVAGGTLVGVAAAWAIHGKVEEGEIEERRGRREVGVQEELRSAMRK